MDDGKILSMTQTVCAAFEKKERGRAPPATKSSIRNILEKKRTKQKYPDSHYNVIKQFY